MVQISFQTLLANGTQTVVDADGDVVTVTAVFSAGFANSSSNSIISDTNVDTVADTFTLTFSKKVENFSFTITDVNSSGSWFVDNIVIESNLNGTPVETNLSAGTSGTTAQYIAGSSNIALTATVPGPFNEITMTNFDPNIQHGWIFLTTAEVGDVVCFTDGTSIETQNGQIAVEDLSVGDLVMTRDRGLQPIRWIGKKELSQQDIEANEKLRPVRIRAGALSDGLPQRDLVVSRQHRMLAVSKVSQRMFGSDEVLISAIKLTDLPNIAVEPADRPVTYYHLLFDQHEIVYAEGAPSESLHTGEQAMTTLSSAARSEIFALFPELIDSAHERQPARPLPEGRRQKRFIARIQKNDQQLLAMAA